MSINFPIMKRNDEGEGVNEATSINNGKQLIHISMVHTS